LRFKASNSKRFPTFSICPIQVLLLGNYFCILWFTEQQLLLLLKKKLEAAFCVSIKKKNETVFLKLPVQKQLCLSSSQPHFEC